MCIHDVRTKHQKKTGVISFLRYSTTVIYQHTNDDMIHLDKIGMQKTCFKCQNHDSYGKIKSELVV